MNSGTGRRDFLLGMGMASLGGLAGGLTGIAPARAGVGWGPGQTQGCRSGWAFMATTAV